VRFEPACAAIGAVGSPDVALVGAVGDARGMEGVGEGVAVDAGDEQPAIAAETNTAAIRVSMLTRPIV